MSSLKTLILSSAIVLQGSALLAMDEGVRYHRTRFINAQLEEIEESPEDYIPSNTRTHTEQVDEIEEFPADIISNARPTSREQVEDIDSLSEEERQEANNYIIVSSSSENEIDSDESNLLGSSQERILQQTIIPANNTRTVSEERNNNSSSISVRDQFIRKYSKKPQPFTNATPNIIPGVTNSRQKFILNNTKPTPLIKKKRAYKKKPLMG